MSDDRDNALRRLTFSLRASNPTQATSCKHAKLQQPEQTQSTPANLGQGEAKLVLSPGTSLQCDNGEL